MPDLVTALTTPPVAWNCRLYDDRRTWNSLIADCEKVNGGRVPPRSSPKKLDCELAPSMLKEFWMPRAPMLMPPRPPSTWLMSLRVAPGVSSTKFVKSRPSSGRLAIDSSETEEVMLGLVVSTIGDSAVTTISSSTADTCRAKFTPTVEPRVTTTPRLTSLLKPGRSALTS